MSFTNINKSWFSVSRLKAQARLRLLCFPYAGGGASIFRAWAAKLPAEIDCWAIQLLGRENRFLEAPAQRMNILLEQLVPVLLPYLDEPYAFFGHSMGALICFELTHELIRLGYEPPVHLLVSSHRAPHLPPTKSTTHLLPEREFLEEVRKLQGTP
ncbi:MAG TPA: thioesterase domain-containing protein, partial [Ktedonobacteraceae bacterium]|nr:thioesterase domain-containing protein [Ktedonobacteraceae bacterium]